MAADTAAARLSAAALAETVLPAATAAETYPGAAPAASDHHLEALRSIHQAKSLTEVLDRLISTAADEAGRAAVLLVRENRLLGWQASGFHGGPDPAASNLPLDAAGIATEAVRTRALAARPDLTRADALGDAIGLPFAQMSGDAPAVAVPLDIEGQVVGVLYADAAAAGRATPPPAGWPQTVEMLALHASRSLEALTLSRARALHRPVAVRRKNAGRDEDAEAARRYARLLVSEIRLYYEPAVNEGRQKADLLARLGPEISRARRLYEERIPAAVRARGEFFDQEILTTLANGDPQLLGQGT
ncbi:MAG: hypothetical protein EHM24_25080 [Acidobacteria bacterium]|nr:MAG: hypothetical protein EHM24_25080 [Acidobacteriota bacterium]RPJ85044.1 MAG: hypothetical protein EHM13_02280 [Acidobacteriota bacterium]